MTFCNNIKYAIYTASEGSFEEKADQLIACLPVDKPLLRLTFFGMPKSNEQFVERREILNRKIEAFANNSEPVLSYVCQPPLSGKLVLEAHYYEPEAGDAISYRRFRNFPYVVLENSCGRFLFAGGFHGDVLNQSVLQQSDTIFTLIDALLKQEQFPINSIVRQWNYIEKITSFDGDDQHYQMFNNARSAFYNQTAWEQGYPAATGIGTDWGGVLVDLDAFVPASDACYITPIDNKLQVAAHAYSEKVLEAAQQHKSTPKFERAKSITCGNSRLIYISGTAAIRGEESLTGVGIEKQLHITMENIAELIGDSHLQMLRVYLKDLKDYVKAEALLSEYPFTIPVSYMCADVCRDELLIEIEGIAKGDAAVKTDYITN